MVCGALAGAVVLNGRSIILHVHRDHIRIGERVEIALPDGRACREALTVAGLLNRFDIHRDVRRLLSRSDSGGEGDKGFSEAPPVDPGVERGVRLGQSNALRISTEELDLLLAASSHGEEAGILGLPLGVQILIPVL